MTRLEMFLEKIFIYRWYVGFFLFAILVLLGIHGSSIGIYSAILHSPDTALWGTNRVIRSDEWMINTPLAFSQYFNGFAYFSDIVRGTATDMFMVYAQPVRDFMVIFRPFQLGYLFLSPAGGLAFFWMGRLIVLFLVSFEFGLLVFERNRFCAVIYACSLSLAPLVQWWFAINAIAEILIFGQAAVLLFAVYLNTASYWKRLFLGVALGFLAVSFALCLYPAWQVSCSYIFLVAAFWLFFKRKEAWHSLGMKDVGIVFLAGVLWGSLCIPIFQRSLPTIEMVRATVYPGSRICLGGFGSLADFFKHGLNYALGLWLPAKELNGFTNNSEAARIFDLAPLGIFLALGHIFRKRMDGLLAGLLLIQGFFLFWWFFSWPVWAAKGSLLSNVTPERLFLAFGVINLILLLRVLALSEQKEGMSSIAALVFSAAGAAVATASSYSFYPDIFNYKYILSTFLLVMMLWYFCLQRKLKALTIGMLIVLLYAGVRVNPIAQGTASIYESRTVQKMEALAHQDDGLWLVMADTPYCDIPIMAGARTINSVNTYPAMERWQKLDPAGKYRDVYNRYALIHVEFSREQTSFESPRADFLTVKLNPEDLPTLGVRYIFTTQDLAKENLSGVVFDKIFEDQGLYIYQLSY